MTTSLRSFTVKRSKEMGPYLEGEVKSRDGLFSDERDDTVWAAENDRVRRGHPRHSRQREL